jgi:biopolymer transport protein ExbD
MSEKRRFLDVWLIEPNTVYREVPFDVVADWVQQGRLLPGDMMRPSGTAEWQQLGDMHDFAVYVPIPPAEPEIESKVEPMEPVETGFSWKQRTEAEDTEVDMIPLIDVSLVLLIFFMLTTKDIGGGGSGVPTPQAQYASVANAPDIVWVGVNLQGEEGARVPVYSCGVGDSAPAEGDRDLANQAQLLEHLKGLLATRNSVDLTINAHPEVRSGDVRKLTVELEKEPFRSKIAHKYTGVSEKTS